MPSQIEWTDETWNPVTGCTRISPGCLGAHCYIERTPPFRMEGRRFEQVGAESTTGVRLHEDRLDQPLRWRKPRRVFVCSLADLFHDDVPDEFIERVFVTMARSPLHTFQVLTKRPERALRLLSDPGTRNFIVNRATSETTSMYRGKGWVGHVPDAQPSWPLPNVWFGVSIENARYTWRADVLREIPAAVRFISAEPLLGSLYEDRTSAVKAMHRADSSEVVRSLIDGGETTADDASSLIHRVERAAIDRSKRPLDLTGIDWVIIGGESGPGARPFHLGHAREIIDAVGAHYLEHGEAPAIFVKQLGAKPTVRTVSVPRLGLTGTGTLVLRDRKGGDMDEWPSDLRIREFPARLDLAGLAL